MILYYKMLNEVLEIQCVLRNDQKLNTPDCKILFYFILFQ